MKKHPNYHLFLAICGLILFGILFLSTLSANESLKIFGNTNYYLFHQLAAIGIGLAFGLIAYKTPVPVLKKLAPFFLLVNLVLIVLIFLPFFGVKFWGAKRWINLGFTTLQPSEFLKLTCILYLSAWLSSRVSESHTKGWISGMKKSYYNLAYVLFPFIVVLGIVVLCMYFQRDITTLGIMILTLLIIYFCAKTPLWHTILLVSGAALSLAVFIGLEPYRLSRLLTFLNPDQDPMGMGYQVKQSLIAVGSGGIFGKGWGMSSQKFGFLPQAMSDSIFAVLGEETGIIGAFIVLSLFLVFLWLAISVARNSSDRFAKLTAIGIGSWITIQAFVNIGSSIGLLPLGGVPLPFFSYGGSHVMSEIIAMGILLNISKS